MFYISIVQPSINSKQSKVKKNYKFQGNNFQLEQLSMYPNDNNYYKHLYS